MNLNPGEIICDECLGTGASLAYNLCPKCQGVGKLDWIEAVVGKKNEFIWDNTEIIKTPLTAKERRLKDLWNMEFKLDVKSIYSEDLFNGIKPR
jgi:RecJ-like exonuclease